MSETAEAHGPESTYVVQVFVEVTTATGLGNGTQEKEARNVGTHAVGTGVSPWVLACGCWAQGFMAGVAAMRRERARTVTVDGPPDMGGTGA